MASRSPGVSIIVPTFNEAANIKPLLERVFAAMEPTGLPTEAIVVDDDSTDGTAGVAKAIAETLPVRVMVRRTKKGLSSAVLDGFEAARYDFLVVMDGDLQHPPEKVPEIVKMLGDDTVDFVIGTRYSKQGSIDTEWPWYRKLGSRVATGLARPLAPLSDPLSGFFGIRAATFRAAQHVDAIGYKIALELFVKAGCRSPAEVPISFSPRTAGKSKLTGNVLVKYLVHLGRLYRFRFPTAWRVFVLVIVGILALTIWAVSFTWTATGES